MLARDKVRAQALAQVFFEDISQDTGVKPEMLGHQWYDLSEAMALLCFAQGEVERAAAVGALVYTASRLP